jgi:hypothetical protein
MPSLELQEYNFPSNLAKWSILQSVLTSNITNATEAMHKKLAHFQLNQEMFSSAYYALP